MSNRNLSILAVLALALGAIALVVSISSATEAPIARGFQCAQGVICFSDGGKTALIPSGARLQAQSGASVQLDSGATFTTAATFNLGTSGALVINSESLSGSVHYGSLGNPANGDRIAHGFTTTPTACTVTPTTTGVVTATITSITTTGFAVSVGATTGVYWMCGR